MKEEFTAIGTIVFENEKKRLALKSSTYFSQCVNRLPTGAEVSVTVSTKKPPGHNNSCATTGCS